MDENTDSTETQPPSTVPAHVQLSLRGLGTDAEWNQRFQQALVDLTVACGRFMDLRLLDGITVGFDYDNSLASVDLGYESSIAKGYTNSKGLIGVGKTLRVKRDGNVRAHVVLNANVLGALTNTEHDEFLSTANIVAHELAHVAIIGWFEEHSPNVMLQPHKGDWVTASLRDAAHTIWEEYAACRLSADVGNETVEQQYAENVEKSVENSFNDAREHIKEYRLHGDISRLLLEVGSSISNPLKIMAYLLGDLDGAEHDADIATLCPTMRDSEFFLFVPDLWSALRDAWEKRHQWNGLKGVDEIVQVILNALAQAGIIVTLNDPPFESYIDVPFTGETMPNGEEDMRAIEMQRMIGALSGRVT